MTNATPATKPVTDSAIIISVDGCADEPLNNWLWDLGMVFSEVEDISRIREATTGEVVTVDVGSARFSVEIIDDGCTVAEAAE